jgi:NADPH:quinone reductase-like Zn-dependent oxidoreductase
MRAARAVLMILVIGMVCGPGYQAAATAAAAASEAMSAIPTHTHRLVLTKAEDAYRWQLIEAALPPLGAHEVLLQVHAVSLNHGEEEMLRVEPGQDHSGMTVGSDAAGEIVAVGSSVHGFHRGERVTNLYFRNWTAGPFRHEVLAGQRGLNADGVFADYVVLGDSEVAPIPEGLSYEEAATLPTAGLTAWAAISEARTLRPGDTVLLQGTGGVSVLALQFAAAMGARVVITSSSDAKLQRAHALGAHDLINYRTTPMWDQRVLELTAGHGADLIVDVGGKDTLAHSINCLADGGALSLVGGLTGYNGQLPQEPLIEKRARVQAIYVGSRADFERMGAFIAAHHLHPAIDRVFPLAQYQDALAYLQSGSFFGKIVIAWH